MGKANIFVNSPRDHLLLPGPRRRRRAARWRARVRRDVPAGGLPPVRGFWSSRCTTNTTSSIRTSSTGSRSGPRTRTSLRQDGSLTLTAHHPQRTKPKGSRTGSRHPKETSPSTSGLIRSSSIVGGRHQPYAASNNTSFDRRSRPRAAPPTKRLLTCSRSRSRWQREWIPPRRVLEIRPQPDPFVVTRRPGVTPLPGFDCSVP